MSVTKLRIHIEYPLRLKVAVQLAVLADAGFRCERPLAGSPSWAASVEVLSSGHRNTGENWHGSLGGQPRQYLQTTSWSGEEHYLQTFVTHPEPGEKRGWKPNSATRTENKFAWDRRQRSVLQLTRYQVKDPLVSSLCANWAQWQDHHVDHQNPQHMWNKFITSDVSLVLLASSSQCNPSRDHVCHINCMIGKIFL